MTLKRHEMRFIGKKLENTGLDIESPEYII